MQLAAICLLNGMRYADSESGFCEGERIFGPEWAVHQKWNSKMVEGKDLKLLDMVFR